MWEIAESIRIERPLAEVQDQFADLAHHEDAAPHRGVTFRILSDSPKACEYEQVTRVGPFRSRQRFVLDRTVTGFPAEQVNRIVAGPFHGGSITFAFRAEGGATEVVAKVRHDPGPVVRLVSPVIGRVLRRSLAAALEEDRADLESGNYEATSSR